MAINPNLQRFVDFYNRLSATNLDELALVYAEDVIFVDPVHQISGLNALTEYFEHAYARLEFCQFEVLKATGDEQLGFVSWTMRFKHQAIGHGKLIEVEGCTALTFNEQGLIIHHRDYFDLTQMVYQHLPLVGWLTTTIKRKMADQ